MWDLGKIVDEDGILRNVIVLDTGVIMLPRDIDIKFINDIIDKHNKEVLKYFEEGLKDGIRYSSSKIR